MRFAALFTAVLITQLAPSPAQAEACVSVGVAVQLPGVSVQLGLPEQPALVLVPGMPVYYAPHLRANYFFYDGLYWVLHGDGWYFSSWYGGPLYAASPFDVPGFVLRTA